MMRRYSFILTLCFLSVIQLAAAESGSTNVRITPWAAPADLSSIADDWVRIGTRNSGTMLAAVERPEGTGPFPVVLILHGSHGFTREYLRLAKELKDHGFMTVAACWFRGGEPGDGTVSPPIPCPDAMAMPPGPSEQARAAIAELVAGVRMLPGVHPDRVALLGHSRGGGATINYLEHGGDVRAAVINSGGYPDEYIDNAGNIDVSVLVLHGMRDSNSEFTTFERARRFGKAVRAARNRSTSVFYPYGVHNGLLADPAQRADELRAIAQFLSKELR